MAWTQVEKQLGAMISGILGRTSRTPDDGWAINPNWIVAAVMSEAETIRMRIKIVDAIMLPILEGSPLKERWKKPRGENHLSARLNKRSNDRNIVVHTEWA